MKNVVYSLLRLIEYVVGISTQNKVQYHLIYLHIDNGTYELIEKSEG